MFDCKSCKYYESFYILNEFGFIKTDNGHCKIENKVDACNCFERISNEAIKTDKSRVIEKYLKHGMEVYEYLM